MPKIFRLAAEKVMPFSFFEIQKINQLNSHDKKSGFFFICSFAFLNWCNKFLFFIIT